MTNHDIRQTFWRADVYRLLALSFEFPNSSLFETIHTLAEELIESSFGKPDLRELIDKLSQESAGHQSTIEASYHHLFSTRVACPPCEGSYLKAERGAVIGDITSFYRAFELQASAGQGPPDAIKMELGFMSFACLKQAKAQHEELKGELKTIQKAQARFLNDHLGRWIPSFTRQLQSQTDNPFYETLASLLSLWIHEECCLLDVQPAPLPLFFPSLSEEEETRCSL